MSRAPIPDPTSGSDPAGARRRLLVLGAGRDQCFMLRCARELGIATFAVDGDSHAPGLPLADHHAVVSNRDVAAIVAAVEAAGVEVHGVSTMGSDIPHVVAAVAEALGLSAIPREAAEIAVDKWRMKQCLSRAGILVPDHRLVHSVEALPPLLEDWGRIVLKPLRQAGSRGVSLVERSDGLEEAWARALRFAEDGAVLVERHLPGDQLSSESLIVDGRVHTPGLADRNYDDLERFLPQIMENGGWVPSRHAGAAKDVDAVIAACARALGMTQGVIKGDLVRVADGRIAVIEVAARLSGGDFSESLVPLGSGVNYVKQVVRQAVGLPVDLPALVPTRDGCVANRYFFPPPGRLLAVEGLDELKDRPWLAKLELWFAPGERIPPLEGHGQRGGVFIVQGQARAEVSRYVEEVYASVLFVVESDEGGVLSCGGDPGAVRGRDRGRDGNRGGDG